MSLTKARKIYRFFDIAALILLAALFCVGMNYVDRNMGGSGVQLPYNAASWLFSVAFMFLTLVRMALFSRLYLSSPLSAFLLFVVILLLPLSYTDTLFLDVESLRLTGLGLAVSFLFFLYQYSSKFLRRNVIKVLFVSTVIQTVWGIIQFYSVFEPNFLFYRAYRGLPYGIFQQVNVFSVYLGFGSLLAIYLLVFNTKYSPLKVAIAGLIVAANTHLMILSESNTGMLVSVCSTLVYLMMVAFYSRKYVPSLLISIACIVALIIPKEWVDIRPKLDVKEVVLSKSVEPDTSGVIGQQTSIDTPKRHSSPFGTRATIYPVVIGIIAESPWTGHGIGSFNKKYALAQGEYLKEHPSAPAEFALNHAHNEVLMWMMELGIVALIAFLFLLLSWTYLIVTKKVNLMVVALAMPLIFQSLLELPFYHSVAHFLGFMVILYAIKNTRSRRFRIPKLLALVTLPVGAWASFKIIVFILSTMHALVMFLHFNQSNRKEISYLLNVNNPAAFKLRFEFELFQWKLSKARDEGRIVREDLVNYIRWAYSTTQYAPMQSTYENFVEALRLFKKPEVAYKYAEEGALMYPDNIKLNVYKEELSNELR